MKSTNLLTNLVIQLLTPGVEHKARARRLPPARPLEVLSPSHTVAVRSPVKSTKTPSASAASL